jgi:hypothetical protein
MSSDFRRWIQRMYPRAKGYDCRRLRYRPQAELLEDRCLLATFTVTINGDAPFDPNIPPPPDKTDLRAAIGLSDKAGGSNVIDFNVSGLPTIDLLGPVQVHAPVLIDATTQPGYAVGKPVIVLDGVIAGINDAVEIYGNNTTVRGLNIQQFPGTGIVIFGNNNKVEGNLIGTDQTGTGAKGNLANQIDIFGNNNTVGGTTPAARNIIAGSSDYQVPALVISGGSGNVIEGNYIGTDVTGTKVIGNAGTAIYLTQAAAHNTIGGTAPGAGNVISGNVTSTTAQSQGFAVVQVDGGGTDGNVIAGNFIGTDPTGKTKLGNGGAGVLIDSAAAMTTIGGTTTGARNIISGNLGDGIDIISGATKTSVAGNYIGINSLGTVPLGNARAGVVITAPGNTIGGTTSAARNIISANKFAGLQIVTTTATGNLVEGNYIGTNNVGSTTSASTLGNQLDGVQIYGGAANNTIGGQTATPGTGPGNVISNNAAAGIYIVDSDANITKNNTVEGNCIGTDKGGTMPLPNRTDGVAIAFGATSNTIGGQGADHRNLISGNARDGIFVLNSNRNAIQGNFIGTDIHGDVPTGTTNPLANLNGVFVNGGSNNTIGAATNAGVTSMHDGSPPSPSSNVIRANKQDGVLINGTAAGNRISLNVIYGNTHMGIDLGGTITTLEAANAWQVYPILTSVTDSGGMTHIQGRLLVSSGTYSIEFYANAVVNHSGLSEGQWFLGTTTATYDPALGYAPIMANFAIPSIPGATPIWNNRPVQDHFISAIAIAANGNTSEFSAARDVLRSAVQVTFSGTKISANFVPESNAILGGRLNLAGAEAVCMVNHFNWLQSITPPAPWQFFTVHNGTATLDAAGVFDPVQNAPAFEYQLRAAGQPNVVIAIEGPTDAFRFVYNEVNEPGSPFNLPDQIKTLPGVGQVLQFGDAPALPNIVAGLLSFRTFLLGIPFAGGTSKNEGAYMQWAGLSSGFRWQSDAKLDAHGNPAGGGVTNVGFLQAVPGSVPSSHLSGGVSGVQFTDAPAAAMVDGAPAQAVADQPPTASVDQIDNPAPVLTMNTVSERLNRSASGVDFDASVQDASSGARGMRLLALLAGTTKTPAATTDSDAFWIHAPMHPFDPFVSLVDDV